VFGAFLWLGLRSFGGPVAHIGYFRAEFVRSRRWVDERTFADLIGLTQFLPGPASSQLGFCVGLLRAGYAGALAAWAGFTLPSAAALVLFASGIDALRGAGPQALLHGLMIVAVAVVAQAVWGMARRLCPDPPRAAIAVLGALLVLTVHSNLAQPAVIALGGLSGWALCRRSAAPPPSSPNLDPGISPRAGAVALAVFAAMLAGSVVLRALSPHATLALFAACYRSGALVFGGGHVVLPLLREAVVVPGWVSDARFLAGYGAAQAVPGPLFSFGAYLGAVANVGPGGVAGAILGLAGLFLPGLLIVVGMLPFWTRLRAGAGAQALLHGVNAAVVGLLAAALYNPVWTSSIRAPADALLALAGAALLIIARVPALAVVLGLTGLRLALTLAGIR